ncbi:MAG: NAD(P)H-hydrate epimerase, partial [Desulfuromonadales bacterium]|nr:NAD(P)H-hydrate epimerase [Desulfuromonadales bacterium]
MKLYRADQVREFDRQTIEEMGISGLVLMENAGVAATELFCTHFRAVFPGAVVVLAGKGNNGGDGYVMARHLHNRGWQVITLVLAEEKAVGGDAAVNLRALTACGGTIAFCPDDTSLSQALERVNARVVIDALFGTGLSSPVRGHYARAIDWINHSRLPVFSVDIPSGIDATSGRVLGTAVKAEETVTF